MVTLALQAPGLEIGAHAQDAAAAARHVHEGELVAADGSKAVAALRPCLRREELAEAVEGEQRR